ncbi:MAG: hypothetical protein ACK4L4_09255 [Gemmobacter sp.]
MMSDRRSGLFGLLLWLVLGLPGLAQTVSVKSGEHEGFTRLVLSLPQPAPWRLWRTEDGYALGLEGAMPRFDLTEVFRLIPRTRLAAIWADPASGQLRLGLACRCHALAFEFRRGIVVIDLRDGPPPAGSPFEAGPDGAVAALPATRPVIRPQRRPASLATPTDAAGYDWRPTAMQAATVTIPLPFGPAPALPGMAATDTALRTAEDWRDRLLAEIARGAARGVVEMTMPRTPDKGPRASPAPPQMRIGNAPVMTRGSDEDGSGRMTGDGRACLPDAVLAIADWGDPQPVARAIGPRTRAVLVEFDQPDPAAVLDAARYLLHIGFGAEARQMLDFAGTDLPGGALLRGMSHILDGDAPPPGDAVFDGMLDCDSAAALWSVLALPTSRGAGRAREAAVVSAFSALPLHLRRHLGPKLADRLMAEGKMGGARALRDAILRAPGDAGAAVQLMSLDLDAATGLPAPDRALAELRAATGVTGLQATIRSLDREVAAARAPDAALVTTAEAMLREFGGLEEARALARSLAPAQALAGDFPRALALASGDAATEARVWTIMAETGSPAAVLAHALRRPGDLPDGLSPEADRAVAARLIAMGFPDEAMSWINPARRSDGADATEDLLLRAEALLLARDGRGALRTVAGLDSPAAQLLRDRAILALGAPLSDDPDTALPTDAAILARRNAQWDLVRALDAPPWRDAAALTDAQADHVLPDEPGALARGRRLQQESAAARATLAVLLAESRIMGLP